MLLLLLACTTPTPDDSGAERPPKEGAGTRWTILVYMDGDNNLESYVHHDINELESGGDGGGVEILVQADRAEGEDDGAGDWTDTRRYRIVGDDDPAHISSRLIKEVGELDMGDPQTLADFLAWGAATAPAEHYALILWDHGSSWDVAAEPPPPPGVASDDESGNEINFVNGEMDDALADFVATNGKLDLIGFDACSMASWEVTWVLKDEADYLVASETSVGGEGFDYTTSVQWLRDTREATAAELGDSLAGGAADLGEYTQSVIDLGQTEAMYDAVNDFADAALADPAAMDAFLAARDAAGGADPIWRMYYLDLGDLAVQASGGPLDTQAASILSSIQGAVTTNYWNDPFEYVNGVTIMADARDMEWLGRYRAGPWAEHTSWDELMLQVYADDQAPALR